MSLVGAEPEDLLAVPPEVFAEWLHRAAYAASPMPIRAQVVLGSRKLEWEELPEEQRQLLIAAAGVLLERLVDHLQETAGARLRGEELPVLEEEQVPPPPYEPDPEPDPVEPAADRPADPDREPTPPVDSYRQDPAGATASAERPAGALLTFGAAVFALAGLGALIWALWQSFVG